MCVLTWHFLILTQIYTQQDPKNKYVKCRRSVQRSVKIMFFIRESKNRKSKRKSSFTKETYLYTVTQNNYVKGLYCSKRMFTYQNTTLSKIRQIIKSIRLTIFFTWGYTYYWVVVVVYKEYVTPPLIRPSHWKEVFR